VAFNLNYRLLTQPQEKRKLTTNSFSTSQTHHIASQDLRRKWQRTDTRKFFFSQRVINGWNGLPAEVINLTSVKSFKNAYNHYYCKDMDNRS